MTLSDTVPNNDRFQLGFAHASLGRHTHTVHDSVTGQIVAACTSYEAALAVARLFNSQDGDAPAK